MHIFRRHSGGVIDQLCRDPNQTGIYRLRRHSGSHWDGIERIAKRADVTAVVDKNPTAGEAMSKLTGARIFRNIHDALEHGDFIAADIMLPHDQHEFAALACFNAGKHVLLEKPIAHTLESAQKILRASRQTDIVFMIAEQSQYWPDIIEARELIDQGAIGEVISASGTYYDRVRRDLFGTNTMALQT